MSRPLSIGITLASGHGWGALGDSDLVQGCCFLLNLLRASPRVARAVLLDLSPGLERPLPDFTALAPAPVLSAREAMELDVVIELGAQIDPDWARPFAARGGRIAALRVANHLIDDAERLAFNLPPAFMMPADLYHAVWTYPAFADHCGSYYSHGMGAPLQVVPPLWSPEIIEHMAQGQQRRFAYQPGRQAWRVAVMERNASITGSCHLPLLAAEAAFRRQPAAIERLLVLHAQKLAESAHFTHYVEGLDILRAEKVSFLAEFPPWEVLGHAADALLAHHWHSPHSHRHYEALHGGFPLVHNSPWLDGCGYAYTDFDPEAGATALLRALAEHDAGLAAYRARAAAFLATLAPTAPVNIARYEAALAALTSQQPLAAT